VRFLASPDDIDKVYRAPATACCAMTIIQSIALLITLTALLPKQRGKAGDVGTVDGRHDIFGIHSLRGTVPPLRVATNDAALHQASKLRVHLMKGCPSRVRKFRSREHHLPVLLSLSRKKALPLERLHGGHTSGLSGRSANFDFSRAAESGRSRSL
jgi:hypothetical protein